MKLTLTLALLQILFQMGPKRKRDTNAHSIATTFTPSPTTRASPFAAPPGTTYVYMIHRTRINKIFVSNGYNEFCKEMNTDVAKIGLEIQSEEKLIAKMRADLNLMLKQVVDKKALLKEKVDINNKLQACLKS